MAETVHVLLVEDDAGFASMVVAALEGSETEFTLERAYQLNEALTRLAFGGIDAVLLDLTLPDAQGLQTFLRINDAALEIPIVVLSGISDENVAMQAVQAGAQDFLVKGLFDIRALDRAIIYAIERQRAQEERNRHITRLALLNSVDDELNRRLDTNYVLRMALDTAVRLSTASAGLLGILEDNRLTTLRNINYTPEVIPNPPPIERGIIGRCLRTREAQHVLDVHDDPDYLPLLSSTKAQIAIPLLSQDRLIGFLNLETSDTVGFSPEAFNFLKLLTARIAQSIDNARLYQTSQQQIDELQNLYVQVRDLERLKTDMIRIATHDLRGPLNNIAQSTYLLRHVAEESANGQSNIMIDAIEESAKRMRAITEDILSLERLQATDEINHEMIDLQALTEKAFQEHHMESRQKAHCFALSLTARPILVMGESSMLYEAITNLINNAVKYTPEGGTVEVMVRRGQRTATLRVVDSGIGIPEDQQGELFQPFFRAKSEAMVGIKGTGLGLHLVKNIITRHEGQMVFKSVYGKGSTFGFRLPLAK